MRVRRSERAKHVTEQPYYEVPIMTASMTPEEMVKAANLSVRQTRFASDELCEQVVPYADIVGLGGLIRKKWNVRIPLIPSEYVLHKVGKVSSERMKALKTDRAAIQAAFALPETGTVRLTDLSGEEFREMFVVEAKTKKITLKFKDVKSSEKGFRTWVEVLNPILNQTKGCSMKKCHANALVRFWRRAQGGGNADDFEEPDLSSYLTKRIQSMLDNMEIGETTYAGPALAHLLHSQGLLLDDEVELLASPKQMNDFNLLSSPGAALRLTTTPVDKNEDPHLIQSSMESPEGSF